MGAVAATGSVAADADSGDKLARLEAAGLTLSERDIEAVSAELDIEVTEDVRTGQALLNQLESDGLLAEATLSVLPDFGATDDADGQIHDLAEGGSREVSFTTTTPRGRLQVTYSESSAPFAALFPEDGSNVLMYVHSDGDSYEQVETSIGTTDRDEQPPTTDDCDNCGGCDCVGDWCLDGAVPRTHKNTCATCDNAECIITTTCGC
ncbi:hypothetical protein [Halobiforma nitratireducens]|uniref:Uncharacterized protein n=1 Tax=Halobiforma nitratireducens JCM 10879 TaxID=1227454 RepID=M0LNW6_9EURY|nr:hypothetical protein [Halobiforma nitratireducens]EMA34803.1 hypothetical protein C446_13474 [Halobiforma nitratireducens JCM 10879]